MANFCTNKTKRNRNEDQVVRGNEIEYPIFIAEALEASFEGCVFVLATFLFHFGSKRVKKKIKKNKKLKT